MGNNKNKQAGTHMSGHPLYVILGIVALVFIILLALSLQQQRAMVTPPPATGVSPDSPLVEAQKKQDFENAVNLFSESRTEMTPQEKEEFENSVNLFDAALKKNQ